MGASKSARKTARQIILKKIKKSIVNIKTIYIFAML